MSDFLQFVDRVPTLPNRKKITHEGGSVEYATVEYADDPVEIGTPLNKINFDILNNVLGYNKVNGIYNPSTEFVEYEVDTFDENKAVDNMRLLIQATNQPSAPATDFNFIKRNVSIGNFLEPKLIEMSNGNIMVGGYNGTTGYIAVLDKQGNIVKSYSNFGSYFQQLELLEMSNGNILIVGNSGSSSYSGYIAILDNQGNIIKNQTSIGSECYSPKLLEMSNGNILIVGADYSNSSWSGYITIIDQQGNIVKPSTYISSSFNGYSFIEMSNGNIMIASNGYTPYPYITIIDQQGNIVKDSSRIYSNQYIIGRIQELSNGHIMISCYTSSNSIGYIITLDQQGDVIYDPINIGTIVRPDFIQMSNGNIMLYGGGYIVITNQQGEIIKPSTSIGGDGNTFIEMSNGNILILSNGSRILSAMILDKDGNIIKNYTTIGSDNSNSKIIEMSDGNIMAVSRFYAKTETIMSVLQPFASNAFASLNGIELDTLPQKDCFYELVYNENQDKFIAEEVRNAN